MSQQLPHMNYPILEGPKSSYMSYLADTGPGLNLVNLEYHQSVAERHPNLVLKFAYMKDLDDVDPFNISRVDGGKESEQGKGGVNVTAVITYKTPFVVNKKPVTFSRALGEGMTCNTIFSWPFLHKTKNSIMTENNALVSGLLGEQFRLEMMVTQRSKETPKTSEGLPVSLPVSIQGKQENTKDRRSRNIRVEMKKTVIHQRHIPGQH